MRVILAAKHAPHGSNPVGGVQSWSRTVCGELEKRGHDVQTWGPEQTLPLPREKFDFGIIANISDTHKILGHCKKRVIVSHGIIPAENPFKFDPSVSTAFTSEEVRDHWGGEGPIIRQPIDLNFWKPGTAKKTYLTRFSYRGGLRFAMTIAQNMNLNFHHIKNDCPNMVREKLQQSVCVLATGRAALEAMACGVPVVIVDHRSAYQKPLMDLDITGSVHRNYSGRGGVTPTVENLTGAINAAISRGSMRSYVKKHHDVKTITDQLLEMA